MKTNRWLWSSVSHPSGNHGFIFSACVTNSRARSLIRRYWDLERLPTGFKLRFDEKSLAYTFTEGDGGTIDGISILPIKLKPQDENQKPSPVTNTRQFQIQCIEDAVSEIINHPLTPALDSGAQLRFKNIILRHLARMV